MRNDSKFILIKDLIKFVTFYFYYFLNYPKRPVTAFFLMDYYLTLYSDYEDFIAYASRFSDNIVQLRFMFNENIIYPLELSTFNRKKSKIFANTRHVYLISLKEEKLIPFTTCKIKQITLDTLFQTDFDPNIVYVLSARDISKIVELYLSTLKHLNSTKTKNYDENYYLTLIDNVFPMVEAMLNNFKNLNLVPDIVFYKNFHGCRYYDCEGVKINDNRFEYYMEKINKKIEKIIKVDNTVPRTDTIVQDKYGKSIEDLYINNTGLQKYFERDSWDGSFIFKNITEFSIQDFVLSILCLTNILSV